MALIICKECGKEISDKATSCPGCGCPVELENVASGELIQNDEIVVGEKAAVSEENANAQVITANKNKKKGIIKVIVAALIVAVIAVVVIVVSKIFAYKKVVGTWRMEKNIIILSESDLAGYKEFGMNTSNFKKLSIPIYIQLNEDKSYIVYVDEEECNTLIDNYYNELKKQFTEAFEAFKTQLCEENMISENKLEALFIENYGMNSQEYMMSLMPDMSSFYLEEGEGIFDYGKWNITNGRIEFSSVRDFDDEKDWAEYTLNGNRLSLSNGHGYLFANIIGDAKLVYNIDNDMQWELVKADVVRNADDIEKFNVPPITEAERNDRKEMYDEMFLANIKCALLLVISDPYTVSNAEAYDYIHYISGETVEITAVSAEDNVFWHDVQKALFGAEGIYPGGGELSDLGDYIFTDGATGKIYMTIRNGNQIVLEIEGTDIEK